MLRDFDHLFVQNERSKRYLAKIGISRVTVVVDTRFDRVLDVYKRQYLFCYMIFRYFAGNEILLIPLIIRE